MSTPDVERFIKLTDKQKELDTKIIRYEEQHKARKEALAELVKQIKADNIDPKDLGNVIANMEKQFKDTIDAYENMLAEVSSKLAKIEG